MMRKLAVASAVLGLAVLAASPARAGFIASLSLEGNTDPQNTAALDWFNPDAAAVTSNFVDSAHPADDTVALTGSTSGDPIYHQTVYVYNASSVTWVGFVLGVSGTPAGISYYDTSTSAYDPLTATASAFPTIASYSANSAVFTGGSLAPSNVVVFNFDVYVPVVDNNFTIYLSEHPLVEGDPVPEPASLGLLGIGAVGLLARKRRRA